jgi:spore maturation protein CgeB
MRMAIIADDITSICLQAETDIYHITPMNYKVVLKFWKPDILFVESAWQGYKNRWKYKIAAYPDYPKRNNETLKKVVSYAKKLEIPTLFWNKEDGVHFDRFIESAKLFDHIFTVDENCIEKYRTFVDKNTTVNVLMFAVQSAFHYFSGFDFKNNKANFIGSYSRHIHKERRMWQNMIFEATCESGMGIDIFDRNSKRKSANYRYSNDLCLNIKKQISYQDTAKYYRDYLISLNVNTIQDSKTMFSRRFIEILACGGIAVTNPTPAIEKYFKDYCYTVSSKEEALTLFRRLENGANDMDRQRARAGAEYVFQKHTWRHRLEEIKQVIGTR